MPYSGGVYGGPFSLRPVLTEPDSDHDQRADCDHHRADKRQLFQHADNDRMDAESSLHMREAPACHTHRISPLAPVAASLFQARRSPAIANSGVSLNQGEGTLARS